MVVLQWAKCLQTIATVVFVVMLKSCLSSCSVDVFSAQVYTTSLISVCVRAFEHLFKISVNYVMVNPNNVLINMILQTYCASKKYSPPPPLGSFYVLQHLASEELIRLF